MILPKTIDEVLFELDKIIVQSKVDQNRLGYFALLYREVTAAVKKGIEVEYFEDGPRMEKLDVIFANRYLKAYDQYQRGENPTRAWMIAFDAAGQDHLLILQHLFLGMNAHINLDLGIAAARVAPENAILDLETDFFRINEILFSLVDKMQQKMAKVSPVVGWLDKIGGLKDERFANFSLTKARDHAWNLANLLAPIPPENWNAPISTADDATAVFASLISQPKLRISRWAIKFLLRLELKDVRENLDLLS